MGRRENIDPYVIDGGNEVETWSGGVRFSHVVVWAAVDGFSRWSEAIKDY